MKRGFKSPGAALLSRRVDGTYDRTGINRKKLKQVSLRPPFGGWNPKQHDPDNVIAAIDAIDAICSQAGISVDFEKTYENTGPLCDHKVSPIIVKLPWNEAMQAILDPIDLSYTFENERVVLIRK